MLRSGATPGQQDEPTTETQAALDSLIDAVTELARSSHLLAERLHDVGLLSDDAATGLLARQDQTDAELRRLRELRSPATPAPRDRRSAS